MGHDDDDDDDGRDLSTHSIEARIYEEKSSDSLEGCEISFLLATLAV